VAVLAVCGQPVYSGNVRQVPKVDVAAILGVLLSPNMLRLT